MFNLLRKKIFFRKIFFNVKISYKLKKKILKTIYFFSKKKNFFINFIFLKEKKFFNIKKKFNLENCTNEYLIFNNNYGNIFFNHFNSDIFINKKKFEKKYLNFYHIFFHVFGFDHTSKRDYKKMLLKYRFFLNKNK
ncbi:hypothetical protein [Candidatus Vidania fulgoroideorum]